MLRLIAPSRDANEGELNRPEAGISPATAGTVGPAADVNLMKKNIMGKAIFCISTSEAQAETIVNQLKEAGFSYNDISVLFPDKAGSRHFVHEQHTKAPEGASAGAGTGGLLGGALGWLAGIGMLAIPGLGPFIAAGPLLAALSGAAVGAAVGGVTGALVGMGIPEYEAKRYEGRVKSGNILISVHSDNHKETCKARDIFEKAGAEDIASAGEVRVKGDQAEPEPESEHAGKRDQAHA